MKKTQLTEIFRLISSTKGFCITLAVVTALGITAFTGISFATTSLMESCETYYDENNFYDIQMGSVYGFSDETMKKIKNNRYVNDAQSAYYTQELITIDSDDYVAEFYTPAGNLNLPRLVSGHMPQKDGECAVEQALLDRFGLDLGETIRITSDSDMLNSKKFIIVGSVDLVTVFATNDFYNRGTSDLGDGQVTTKIMLDASAFTDDALRQSCYVTVKDRGVRGSDEYFTYMEKVRDELMPIVQAGGEEEYNRLHSDYQTQLDDAQEEYNQGEKDISEAGDAIEEAEQELEDSQKKLEENQQKLESGELTLEQTRQELDAYENQLASSRTALDEAKSQLAVYQSELDSARAQLDDAKIQLDAARSELDSVKPQLDSASIQLEQTKAQLDASAAILEPLSLAMNTAAANLESMQATMNPEDPISNMIYQGLQNAFDEANASYQAQLGSYNEALSAYDAANAEYQTQYEAYQVAEGEYASKEQNYVAGEAEYNSKLAGYNAAAAAYEEGEKEYTAGLQQLAEYERQYAEKSAELNSGKAQIYDAKTELSNGSKELDEKKKELEEKTDELVSSKETLEQAKQDLNDMPLSQTFSSDINGNPSYYYYSQITHGTDTIVATVCTLMMGIAILVCFTTISRMVTEQHRIIGTQKAMGFLPFEIYWKYIAYAAICTLLGIVLGVACSYFIVEKLVYQIVYGSAFIIDEFTPVIDWSSTLLIALLEMAIMCLSSFFACHSMLQKSAVALLNDNIRENKELKTGKKIILPVRVSLVFRNLRSNPKILMTTFVSVMGCTILMIAVFTVHHGMAGIAPRQFNELQHYQGTLTLNKDDNKENMEEMEQFLKETDTVQLLPVMEKFVSYQADGVVQYATLIGIDPSADSTPFLKILDAETLEPVNVPDEGVLICKKMAENYGFHVGDKFILLDSMGGEYSTFVAGIFDRNIGMAVIVSPKYYSQLMGTDTDIYQYYVMGSDYAIESFIAEAKTYQSYCNYSDSAYYEEEMEFKVKCVDEVIIVVLVMTALLSIFVLFNLAQMNIRKKEKDIVVMKVLGVPQERVKGYVFWETMAMCTIGLIFGVIVGGPLGSYLTKAVEMSNLQDIRGISAGSCLLGGGINFAFYTIINLLSLVGIKNIKMTGTVWEA